MSLKEKALRTRAADFIDKNFTLDLVYRFDPGDAAALTFGIGENGRETSGGCTTPSPRAVRGPPTTGSRSSTFHGHARDFDPVPRGQGARTAHGGASRSAATHSRSRSAPATRDKFEPHFSKTIPALKAVAPYLTPKNSYLFFGGGGVVEQVRLVVEGQATESQDLALDVPPRVVEGKPVRQRIAKAGGPASRRFTLESGPKGLTLTPAGELAWSPGKDQVGKHELKVRVQSGADSTLARAEIEVVSAEDAAAVKGDLAKVDALHRLPLAGEQVPARPGPRLRVDAAAPGRRVAPARAGRADRAGDAQAPRPLRRSSARRAAYFVALSDEAKRLDLIDKKTLQVTRSVQMDYRERYDLALNPVKDVCYVAVRSPAKA